VTLSTGITTQLPDITSSQDCGLLYDETERGTNSMDDCSIPSSIHVNTLSAVLGIDAGSTRIKGALWTGNCWYLSSVPASVSYENDVVSLISSIKDTAKVPHFTIISTGYGRKLVPGVNKTINEIRCHAAGAHYMVPDTRTVIDIGGQDAKIILVTPDGKIADFVMNDKCAAGTGRFLAVLGERLSVPLEEMGKTAFGQTPLRLSSMCTVFAESEVISLLSKGHQVPEILAGIHDAIARRTISLASRLKIEPVITFLGGVSGNQDIVARISDLTRLPINVPDYAEYSGAIGAVLSTINPPEWCQTEVNRIHL